MNVEILAKNPQKHSLVPDFNFKRLRSTEYDADLFGEIAKLRYEVYCTECKYLNEADYENGLETDHLDDRSIHIAAQSADGVVAGTARLVFAQEGEDFPFAEYCSTFPDFKLPAKTESAEVSRLIVKKSFRHRAPGSMGRVSREFQKKRDAASIDPQTKAITGQPKCSSSPMIMLGMYREMYRYSLQNEIRYWYAAMEKGLARLLGRMGFSFVPVGPETDYYGPVTTYFADLRELEMRLRKTNQLVLDWFQEARRESCCSPVSTAATGWCIAS